MTREELFDRLYDGPVPFLPRGHLFWLLILLTVPVGLFLGCAFPCLSTKLAVTTLLGLLTLLLTFTYPFIGLLIVFVLTTFKTYDILPVRYVSFSKLLCLVVVFAFVMEGLLRKDLKLKLGKLEIALLLLVLYQLVSSFWSYSFSRGLLVTFSLASLVGLYFIVTILVDDERKLKLSIILLFLASGVLALLSFYDLLSGSMTQVGYKIGGFFRMAGFQENPNSLGQLLSFIVVLAISLAASRVGFRFRFILIVFLVPLALLLFMTFSRGAWVGTAAAMFFLILGYLKKRSTLAVVLIVLVAGIFVFLPEEFHERIMRVDEDDASRFDTVRFCSALYLTKPITGIGTGAQHRATPSP